MGLDRARRRRGGRPAERRGRRHRGGGRRSGARRRDPDRARDAVESAGRVQAWIAGPGMGTGPAAGRLLAAVLATDVPVLVDADGLTIVARDRTLLRRSAPTLITPHAGELARILGV